jgi:hypothetical protein
MQTQDYCQCGCGGVVNPGRRCIQYHGRKAPPPEQLIAEQDCGYSSPCWMWQGTLTTAGYGQYHFTVNGVLHYPMAHRLMWEKANGPIPDGLHIDHLCRNPPCVNPDHLEPVTPRENAYRGNATKVTDEEALEIRRRRAAGETAPSIARDYPIGESAVRSIAQGHTRKHLPMAS